jgi:YD repeat-containing protein
VTFIARKIKSCSFTAPVAQGALSLMQGGNFWSGAAAGFLGHLGAEAWGASMKGLGYGQFAGSTGGIVTFGALSGGIGAELTGGNFWQGAVTGGIVSGLNHAMHSGGDDDRGYDKNGNQINDNGGETTDYMYDDNGKIINTVAVSTYGPNPGFTSLDGTPAKLTMRGFGVKSYTASGAITEDNTIFELYAGTKALNLAGKGFNALTGGLKQWIRIGNSYSIKGGFKTVSLRWGAGGNYWKKIGSEYLQGVNKSFRQMKISFDNWRTADAGHFHLWKK